MLLKKSISQVKIHVKK